MSSRIVFCVLLAIPSAVSATTTCVSTTPELRAALTAAQGNGEDDVILVQPGLYFVNEPLIYSGYENFDLSVSGGWDFACLSHLRDPSLTVIDGLYTSALANFLGWQDTTGDISVSWLTLRRGVGADGVRPVELGGYAGWQGILRVENNVFTQIEGRTESGLTAVERSSDLGEIHVRNNVFADNATDNGTTPVDLIANNDQSAIVGTFANNTLAGGSSAGSGIGGARIVGAGIWEVANNVFWGNDGYDLTLGGSVFLHYNDIGSYTGSLPLGASHNLSVDPGYVDAADGNYRLRGNSPLVDSGWNDAPEGLGAFDAAGGLRMVGANVDIGAYELQDRIFAGDFESP